MKPTLLITLFFAAAGITTFLLGLPHLVTLFFLITAFSISVYEAMEDDENPMI